MRFCVSAWPPYGCCPLAFSRSGAIEPMTAGRATRKEGLDTRANVAGGTTHATRVQPKALGPLTRGSIYRAYQIATLLSEAPMLRPQLSLIHDDFESAVDHTLAVKRHGVRVRL